MRVPHVPAFLALLTSLSCANVPIASPPRNTGDSGTGTGASSPGATATEIVIHTNEARARNGMNALAANSRLMEAARIHAAQMASRRQLSHTINGAQYPAMQDRLAAVEYVYSNAAENIAWNQADAREAVRTWMNSNGHRANILDGRVTEMGAAMARSAQGEPYWIQVFGRPR